jgi:hypothetical protein
MKKGWIDTLVVNMLMTVQPDLGANKIGTDSMTTDDLVTSPCKKINKKIIIHKKKLFFHEKRIDSIFISSAKVKQYASLLLSQELRNKKNCANLKKVFLLVLIRKYLL